MASCGFSVIITFVKANGLAIGDILTSDPYVKASIGDKIFFRTRPIMSTVNPEWNDEWRVVNVPGNFTLKIGIWDHDNLNKDDLLGECDYVFNGYVGETTAVLDVMRNKKAHGSLTLKIVSQPSETHGEMHSTGPVRYEVYTSSLAGAITKHKNDDDTLCYTTHAIYMPHISTIFGAVKQPWNVKYEKAKMIFDPKSAQSAIIRKMIHCEHQGLYKHDKTSKYGILATGQDFLKLINYGKRKGVCHFYTYVILEDCIRFSETGAAFFTDFMSKHAMHSNCSEEVYFAGEFHIEEVDGKHKLVIDNNSGTYAPDKSKLEKLAQLFKRNFPDLEVGALDKDDPHLQEFRNLFIN